MASVALARKLSRDEIRLRGATPCVGLLTLADYLEELKPWKVEAHEIA